MSTQEMHANMVLDLKGLTCPAPLLGAKKLVDDLQAGQILLLISDCKGTQDDLFAWARQTGNQVLKTAHMPGGGTGYYIMKGKDKALKANVTLDIRGVACPGPIVEAKKLLNGMKSGEVLKLVSNCPGTQADITSWTAATGMKLLDTVKITADDYEFFIQKA
ncbi:MAG: sulfurtransferase TusA family protein [Nitrosomonadales bacterium]|nr:sulfurtransferase TusA family protein [Nitrosomonadales bacterium]